VWLRSRVDDEGGTVGGAVGGAVEGSCVGARNESKLGEESQCPLTAYHCG